MKTTKKKRKRRCECLYFLQQLCKNLLIDLSVKMDLNITNLPNYKQEAEVNAQEKSHLNNNMFYSSIDMQTKKHVL